MLFLPSANLQQLGCAAIGALPGIIPKQREYRFLQEAVPAHSTHRMALAPRAQDAGFLFCRDGLLQILGHVCALTNSHPLERPHPGYPGGTVRGSGKGKTIYSINRLSATDKRKDASAAQAAPGNALARSRRRQTVQCLAGEIGNGARERGRCVQRFRPLQPDAQFGRHIRERRCLRRRGFRRDRREIRWAAGAES